MAEVTQADREAVNAIKVFARAWWAQRMERSTITAINIQGDGCVKIHWRDPEETGSYVLPVDFMDQAARHRTEAVKPLLDGTGFVFWNPDSGEEYSDQHPIKSGECPDAERVRKSTAQEDVLWAAFQEQFQRAEAVKPLVEALEAIRDKCSEKLDHTNDWFDLKEIRLMAGAAIEGVQS